MPNKVAIIDLGTNTFHLLIAEEHGEGYRIIHRDRLATKIGMGGINDGLITESAIRRALLAMQSFRNTLDQHNVPVQQVYAFGTSAFRNARNGAELAGKIKELTGIEVNILSGDEEAETIYRGVKSALDLGDEMSLIIDIGGGSVEFIIADRNRISWKISLEIGAQRLLEKFHRHDPILPEEVDALNNYLVEALKPLMGALEQYKPEVLVGSSGTFDTLSDIFCCKHQIEKLPEEVETPLTLEGFYEIYDELLVKNREERLRIPGMIEMRVDMIIVACCLIRFLLEKHAFRRIRVSSYALKEGALARLSEQKLSRT